jgi:Cu(I)/Ag(I) efflux system membrane fusion protein
MSWIGLTAMQGQSKEWNQLLKDYLAVEDALVASNVANAKDALVQMQKDVLELQPVAEGKTSQEKELKFLAAYLDIYTKSNSLEDIRTGFGKISGSMIVLAEQKVFAGQELYVMNCPMKKVNWLADSDKVKNPYYGKAMLTCGSVKKTINK